ncbi:hypothetical protein BT96DRAFT_575151 [Gymnopus androsaceus JB14]|uniref:Uncharacterized protein n=1 Tax=Gymnopus androsaceus JB14 TaxID=1447944 RepID=A0A6A4GIV6_9AGAR|nr:hypothetical protein BT96DRAFT_575151 [Gymnopus androsaceus JB14]
MSYSSANLDRNIPGLHFADMQSGMNTVDHMDKHFSAFNFLEYMASLDFKVREGFVEQYEGTISLEVVYKYTRPKVVPVAQLHPLHKNIYKISGWAGYKPDADRWTRIPYFDLKKIGQFLWCSISRKVQVKDFQTLAWLAQVHYIFQRTDGDNLEDYYFLDTHVEFELDPLQSKFPSLADNHIFLCIAPINITIIDRKTYFSFNNPSYIWSSSPDGSEALSHDMVKALGLPSLTPYIHCMKGIGSGLIHQAAAEYMKYKGFDPSTQDYAQSQGYPLFEILPSASQDDDHFETVKDDNDQPVGLHKAA